MQQVFRFYLGYLLTALVAMAVSSIVFVSCSAPLNSVLALVLLLLGVTLVLILLPDMPSLGWVRDREGPGATKLLNNKKLPEIKAIDEDEKDNKRSQGVA